MVLIHWQKSPVKIEDLGLDSQNTYLQLIEPFMLEKQGISMQKVTCTVNAISYPQNKTHHVQLL